MVFLFNGKVKQKVHDVSQNNSKIQKYLSIKEDPLTLEEEQLYCATSQHT